jgi:DNA-binding phage protein
MNARSYREDLLKGLKDPEYASAYLAEALKAEDQSVFLLAVRDVVEASGGASALVQ